MEVDFTDRFKRYLIYGVIILLCIVAIAGYLVNKRSGGLSAMIGKGDTAVSLANNMEAQKQKHVQELLQKGIKEPDQNPVIGIGRGEDYAKVTQEAIDNAGGLKGVIKKGDVVLIKPNLCLVSGPGSPITTDYRTVQKIVDMARQLGASRIIIAEGTIAGNAFDSSRLVINRYDTIKGFELINLNSYDKKDCYSLKPLKSMTGESIYIPNIYIDADVVIDVAKLKTHGVQDAPVSLSLKNAIGIPSGLVYGAAGKVGLHNLGLKEAIIDINRIRKPDFSVIEGIVGGEGIGPGDNTPVKSDIIFAGKDQVALDTIALTFMGFNMDEVIHVKLASEEKLGISDLKKIKVVGADLNSIKIRFKRPFE